MAHHHQHTSPPRGCWGGRSREHPLLTQIHCFSSPASVTTPGKWTLNLGSCLRLYLLHSGIIKNDLVIMQRSSAVCNTGGHQVPISRENRGEGRVDKGKGERRKRRRKEEVGKVKRKRWRKGPRALQRKSPFPGGRCWAVALPLGGRGWAEADGQWQMTASKLPHIVCSFLFPVPSQLPPALSSTSWEAGDISGPLFWGPGFSQVKRGQMEGQKEGAGRVWRTQLKSAWEVLVIPSSLCTLLAAAEQEERAQPGMLICLRHWALTPVSPEAGLCWGLRRGGGERVYPPSLSLLCRRFLSRRSMFKGRDSKLVTSPPKKVHEK